MKEHRQAAETDADCNVVEPCESLFVHIIFVRFVVIGGFVAACIFSLHRSFIHLEITERLGDQSMLSYSQPKASWEAPVLIFTSAKDTKGSNGSLFYTMTPIHATVFSFA